MVSRALFLSLPPARRVVALLRSRVGIYICAQSSARASAFDCLGYFWIIFFFALEREKGGEECIRGVWQIFCCDCCSNVEYDVVEKLDVYTVGGVRRRIYSFAIWVYELKRKKYI